MRTGGGGSIVNMASVTSDITAVPANGLYAATKGGVNALTKAAAVEVAKDNISVNSLAFAAIDIPGDMIWRFLDSQGIAPEQLVSMFPIGRMGRPEELVAAVRYLCSDDARYVTGTMLVLDGGYTAQLRRAIPACTHLHDSRHTSCVTRDAEAIRQPRHHAARRRSDSSGQRDDAWAT